jgi:hypothetical protein
LGKSQNSENDFQDSVGMNPIMFVAVWTLLWVLSSAIEIADDLTTDVGAQPTLPSSSFDTLIDSLTLDIVTSQSFAVAFHPNTARTFVYTM